MLQRDSWHIKDFALVKEIGSGAVSCVYYALCRRSCLRVAIKVYNKAKLTKLNARQVEREIFIHSSLNHAHIVNFYAAFEDHKGIYLVLEYAEGGDLFDAVKRKGGRMQEAALVQQVLYPYLCSLTYLHARGIVHRDIKPENTVFTRECVLKITDFGLAVNMREERPVTRLGTLDYMAPEVLRCPDKYLPSDNKERGDLMYNEAVDAWAMGVLAYELIVGRPPFGMADREGTMSAITQLQPSMPHWMSAAAASFIAMALDKSPATRAPIARLIQHPWIMMHTRPQGDVLLQPAVSPLYSSLTRVGSGQLSTSSGCASAMALHAKQSNMQRLAAAGALSALSNSTALSSGLGCSSAGSSFTGAGWHLGGQAQGHGPLAPAASGPSAAPDPRPAKRLLQRCATTYMSDGGGGAQGRVNPEAAANAKVQAQAYWCNLGPGWGMGDPTAAAAVQGLDDRTGCSNDSLNSSQSLQGSPSDAVAPSWDGGSERVARTSSIKRRMLDFGSEGSHVQPPPSMMHLLLDAGATDAADLLASNSAGDSAAVAQGGPRSSPTRSAGSLGQHPQHPLVVPAAASASTSPTGTALHHQHQLSRFSKVKRAHDPASAAEGATGEAAGGQQQAAATAAAAAALQFFGTRPNEADSLSLGMALLDAQQRWQQQSEVQQQQQQGLDMDDAMLNLSMLQEAYGSNSSSSSLALLQLLQAGGGGPGPAQQQQQQQQQQQPAHVDWAQALNMQSVRSHPLTSPCWTPVNSPRHPSAGDRKLSRQGSSAKSFFDAAADMWQQQQQQQLDLGAVTAAMAAAAGSGGGAVQAAPARSGSGGSNSASSGDSVPDVIRLLASSQDVMSSLPSELQLGGITRQQHWQHQGASHSQPLPQSLSMLDPRLSMPLSGDLGGSHLLDLGSDPQQQQQLANLLALQQQQAWGPSQLTHLRMPQGQRAPLSRTFSGPGARGGLPAFPGQAHAGLVRGDSLPLDRSCSITSMHSAPLQCHVPLSMSPLGRGGLLPGNAFDVHQHPSAATNAGALKAAAWQQGLAATRACAAGNEHGPVNMDLLLPFLELDGSCPLLPGLAACPEGQDLDVLLSGMDVDDPHSTR